MKSSGANHEKFAPLISKAHSVTTRALRARSWATLVEVQQELADEKFKIIDLYTGNFANSVTSERQYYKCTIKEFVCVIAANFKECYCHGKAYLSDGCVGGLMGQLFKELWLAQETDERLRPFDAVK